MYNCVDSSFIFHFNLGRKPSPRINFYCKMELQTIHFPYVLILLDITSEHNLLYILFV